MSPVNFVDPFGEGILRVTLEKIYVNDKKQIPGNINGSGLGKTEIELKDISYKINKIIKNGVELNKVEFDISVNIKAYWSWDDTKFTAMHELGHVEDMNGYLIINAIQIFKKVEKMEFTDAQLKLLNKKINNAIVDFGYGLAVAQMQSIMIHDFELNLFWFGLNMLVDVGKTVILKMPKTGAEIYDIKF